MFPTVQATPTTQTFYMAGPDGQTVKKKVTESGGSTPDGGTIQSLTVITEKSGPRISGQSYQTANSQQSGSESSTSSQSSSQSSFSSNNGGFSVFGAPETDSTSVQIVKTVPVQTYVTPIVLTNGNTGGYAASSSSSSAASSSASASSATSANADEGTVLLGGNTGGSSSASSSSSSSGQSSSSASNAASNVFNGGVSLIQDDNDISPAGAGSLQTEYFGPEIYDQSYISTNNLESETTNSISSQSFSTSSSASNNGAFSDISAPETVITSYSLLTNIPAETYTTPITLTTVNAGGATSTATSSSSAASSSAAASIANNEEFDGGIELLGSNSGGSSSASSSSSSSTTNRDGTTLLNGNGASSSSASSSASSTSNGGANFFGGTGDGLSSDSSSSSSSGAISNGDLGILNLNDGTSQSASSSSNSATNIGTSILSTGSSSTADEYVRQPRFFERRTFSSASRPHFYVRPQITIGYRTEIPFLPYASNQQFFPTTQIDSNSLGSNGGSSISASSTSNGINGGLGIININGQTSGASSSSSAAASGGASASNAVSSSSSNDHVIQGHNQFNGPHGIINRRFNYFRQPRFRGRRSFTGITRSFIPPPKFAQIFSATQPLYINRPYIPLIPNAPNLQFFPNTQFGSIIPNGQYRPSNAQFRPVLQSSNFGSNGQYGQNGQNGQNGPVGPPTFSHLSISNNGGAGHIGGGKHPGKQNPKLPQQYQTSRRGHYGLQYGDSTYQNGYGNINRGVNGLRNSPIGNAYSTGVSNTNYGHGLQTGLGIGSSNGLKNGVGNGFGKSLGNGNGNNGNFYGDVNGNNLGNGIANGFGNGLGTSPGSTLGSLVPRKNYGYGNNAGQIRHLAGNVPGRKT